MFNIKDMIKYSTPMNPKANWGVIVEILHVKDSIHDETKGLDIYKVKPLDEKLGHDFVEQKNIIQAYSMYYERD